MSKDNMTTTIGMFKVQDITFKGARNQDDVAKEIEDKFGREEVTREGVQVPVSLTPEQVKNFYYEKIENTQRELEKKLYMQTIMWIDDMLKYKKELVSIKMKQVNEDTPDDIEE